jgi:hypothetical protein
MTNVKLNSTSPAISVSASNCVLMKTKSLTANTVSLTAYFMKDGDDQYLSHTMEQKSST